MKAVSRAAACFAAQWCRVSPARGLRGAPQPLRRALRSTLSSAHRPCPELGTAEAQVAVPVRGLAAVAVRRAHVPRIVDPRAAPDHAVGGRRFGRRRASFLGIVIHPNIRAPLPHIPQHVVQAPGIRFLAGDGVGLISAVLVVPRDGIEVFRVTRGLRPRAAGVLPLSLRGKRQLDTIKPGIQRRQEFLALFPAHRFHGTIRLPWTIRHLEVGWDSLPSRLPRGPGCKACQTSRNRNRSSPGAAVLHRGNRPSSSSGDPIQKTPGGIQRRRWTTSPTSNAHQGPCSRSSPHSDAQVGGMPRWRG